MMQGYFKTGSNELSVFDAFYRRNPSEGGYAIAAGLEQVLEYVDNLRFTQEDMDYLNGLGIFDEDFLEYLRYFKFSGDIYAIPEGTVVFPKEPLIKVVAPIMEAQLLEPAILNMVNHQCLIATKASRVCYAAKGEGVMEFGLRRAMGPDAAIYGARAAMIGGCIGTSNVMAGQLFKIPVKGTHAHSWIMSFGDEYEAFKAYAQLYPNACILLVDTYDTLGSGVPNAIRVFKEMRDEGHPLKNYGIRIDSGDLAYTSKMARKMLDEAGFEDCVISASSDLDEYLIQSLKEEKAAITSWGVGTNMITSHDWPSFGGVYKLAMIQDRKTGEFIPKIKISGNTDKITNPGNKKIYRLYGRATGKIIGDLICLEDEVFTEEDDIMLFDPVETWKRTRVRPNTFRIRELLVPVYKSGKRIYKSPPVMEIRDICTKEQNTMWDETRRFANPNTVYVDLSRKLYDTKQALLAEHEAQLVEKGIKK